MKISVLIRRAVEATSLKMDESTRLSDYALNVRWLQKGGVRSRQAAGQAAGEAAGEAGGGKSGDVHMRSAAPAEVL